jgi:hypothetical protein
MDQDEFIASLLSSNLEGWTQPSYQVAIMTQDAPSALCFQLDLTYLMKDSEEPDNKPL